MRNHFCNSSAWFHIFSSLGSGIANCGCWDHQHTCSSVTLFLSIWIGRHWNKRAWLHLIQVRWKLIIPLYNIYQTGGILNNFVVVIVYFYTYVYSSASYTTNKLSFEYMKFYCTCCIICSIQLIYVVQDERKNYQEFGSKKKLYGFKITKVLIY